ncbi:MAG: YajD family HNH nuclease [bacterium]
MYGKGFRVRKKAGSKDSGGERPAEEIVRELKRSASPPGSDYRERSLKIHGLICAKCAREFEWKDRHLLTVHHKDGNHRNNPPDGSNWENLCVYCHEDEHSRQLLGDYLSQGPKE